MSDLTAQFLAGRIDEFIRLLDRMAVASERTAVACEAMASAEYEAEANVDGDGEGEPEPEPLQLDKLDLGAR